MGRNGNDYGERRVSSGIGRACACTCGVLVSSVGTVCSVLCAARASGSGGENRVDFR